MNDFLNESQILPPNLWNPDTRIEPPDKCPKNLATNSNRGRQLQDDSLLIKDSNQNLIENKKNLETKTIANNNSYYNRAFYLDDYDRNLMENSVTKNLDSYACCIEDKMTIDSDAEEEQERIRNGLIRSGR